LNFDKSPGTYMQNGCYIERDVPCDSVLYDGKIDVLRCPSISPDWRYEFAAGVMSDRALLCAMNMHQWGMTQGIELGRKQLQEELRKLLGVAQP
jgi:hypothetical protein